jgi:hypothetical protein
MMVKIIQVGLYWKAVKGRFSQGKSGAQRSYLTMKYGFRWLSRANTKYGKLLRI